MDQSIDFYIFHAELPQYFSLTAATYSNFCIERSFCPANAHFNSSLGALRKLSPNAKKCQTFQKLQRGFCPPDAHFKGKLRSILNAPKCTKKLDILQKCKKCQKFQIFREGRKCKIFCPANAHFDGRLRGAVCSLKSPLLPVRNATMLLTPSLSSSQLSCVPDAFFILI